MWHPKCFCLLKRSRLEPGVWCTPVVQHLGGEGKGDPELKSSASWWLRGQPAVHNVLSQKGKEPSLAKYVIEGEIQLGRKVVLLFLLTSVSFPPRPSCCGSRGTGGGGGEWHFECNKYALLCPGFLEPQSAPFSEASKGLSAWAKESLKKGQSVRSPLTLEQVGLSDQTVSEQGHQWQEWQMTHLSECYLSKLPTACPYWLVCSPSLMSLKGQAIPTLQWPQT